MKWDLRESILLHEIKLKGIITMQEVELRWHYIKIKLKAMRKDRVKIRINDGITWNKLKANNSVKGEQELRWHYIDEIKWMAMIKNKLGL